MSYSFTPKVVGKIYTQTARRKRALKLLNTTICTDDVLEVAKAQINVKAATRREFLNTLANTKDRYINYSQQQIADKLEKR